MIGKTIKQIRKEKKISQKDLADNVGISVSYLSLIENERKKPLVTMLEKICIELEVPLPVLFFLSLNDIEVSIEKREAFSMISAPMKSYLFDLFVSKK